MRVARARLARPAREHPLTLSPLAPRAERPQFPCAIICFFRLPDRKALIEKHGLTGQPGTVVSPLDMYCFTSAAQPRSLCS